VFDIALEDKPKVCRPQTLCDKSLVEKQIEAYVVCDFYENDENTNPTVSDLGEGECFTNDNCTTGAAPVCA